MPDQPISAASRSACVDAEDRVQVAIICHALDVHPGPLTTEELLLAVLAGSPDAAERDTARNSLRGLLRDGLLRQHGELLLPVRPVVRFNELRTAGM